MLITVIGRGHSGTRAMSHTLTASGVWMGDTLNGSGDLLPPQDMYEACRVMAKYVEWRGGLEWDFSKLHSMPIPGEFRSLIESYLKSVLPDEPQPGGWKIPETTLVYPWILRMFPEIRYIFWVRDPRDCVAGAHLTDDLADFGIDYPRTDDVFLRRAISWKYQYDIVRATPRPAHWIEVRFEDFVLKQDETLARLEDYLEIKLAKIPVNPDAVDRYKLDEGINYFPFFEDDLRAYGYEVPDAIAEKAG